MSVFRIFPSSDATIYSRFPAKNTGLDSTLEVSVKNSKDPGNINISRYRGEVMTSDDIRRSLIKFSNTDISKLSAYTSGSWKSYLKMYLANAENLTENYAIELRAIDQSWTMGTGKFIDFPDTRNGVCWYNTSLFTTSSTDWTGNMSYYLVSGGGSWNNIVYSQSFDKASDKDIYCEVTNMVSDWIANPTNNNGIIVKHTPSIENNSGSFIALNYFSIDTHTIYQPFIEIKWDDSEYITGNLQTISTSDAVVNLSNNLGSYRNTITKHKFRVWAREKYPQRSFTTSSIYTNFKILPETSYWALQDLKTSEMVVDYDTDYTKISCDGTSSYFDVHMAGLQNERYYKILVKSILDNGEELEVDNNMIFKVSQ